MNELLYTAEVRWFFRGRLPVELLAWFTDEGASGRAAALPAAALPWERTDHYLLLPGCATVGVKQREGRFEIKALCGAPEPVRYGEHVTAMTDTWVKWSAAGAGVDAFLAGLQADPAGWLAVEKRRRLRKFSLDTQKPVEVAPTDTPQEGGNVELTAVRAGQSDWWSIGVEAYGPPPAVRRHLDRVATHFFAHHPPPRPLSATRACAYPVWLNTFAPLSAD